MKRSSRTWLATRLRRVHGSSNANLVRATRPFPIQVRTLDALHLASVAVLRERGREVTLATYDGRMRDAAKALDVPLLGMED